MCTLYESILSLCTERGIKGGKMCVDLGLSKSLMSDVISGRALGMTAETAQNLADYFIVSVDRVLTGEETEKTPTPEGRREVPKEELMAAFWGGDKDLSREELDAMWKDVERFAAFVAEQKRRERGKNT